MVIELERNLLVYQTADYVDSVAALLSLTCLEMLLLTIYLNVSFYFLIMTLCCCSFR